MHQGVDRDLVHFDKLIISPHFALFIIVKNEEFKLNTATIYKIEHCHYFLN